MVSFSACRLMDATASGTTLKPPAKPVLGPHPPTSNRWSAAPCISRSGELLVPPIPRTGATHLALMCKWGHSHTNQKNKHHIHIKRIFCTLYDGKMSRSGSTSRSKIAQFKKRVEDLTYDLQAFCLNPTVTKYKEICSCEPLRRNEADDFVIWQMAVLFKFGSKWGLPSCDGADESHTCNNNECVVSASNKFLDLDEQLCGCYQGDDYIPGRALGNPSRTIANKLWHMYFGTGELKYADLVYQLMGHVQLPVDSRRYIADIYKNVRELYVNRIADYCKKDPEHFNKLKALGVTQSDVDFSYFDGIKERAMEEKKKVEDANNMIESMMMGTQAQPSNSASSALAAEKSQRKVTLATPAPWVPPKPYGV